MPSSFQFWNDEFRFAPLVALGILTYIAAMVGAIAEGDWHASNRTLGLSTVGLIRDHAFSEHELREARWRNN
jgi:hypothetical protein